MIIILILMQGPVIQQSPRIAKISTSSQQFRQLINSLRNNHRLHRQEVSSPFGQNQIKQEIENKSNSTYSISQRKFSSQNGNFIAGNDGDGILKPVRRMEIDGRDTLKKIQVEIDINPQIIQPSPRIKEITKQASVQLTEKSKQQTEKSKQFNKSIFIHSPKKNASTQCEIQQSFIKPQMESNFILQPTKNIQKIGQIVRQKVKNECIPENNINGKKIRDISQQIVIEYWEKQIKINQKSQPSQIFSYFTNLCMACDIIIKSPSIKKFKNCIYYGYPISKDQFYEGFLYFYDNKIYYGQFLAGLKHGLGVQLQLAQQIKYKGQFKEGHKSGKFYVEKRNQKYIGFIENGLYQGEGRLSTEDYIYEGFFDRGEKSGYGEEFYPKTGVRISGIFRNGILQKTKASKSIPEIRNKPKTHSSTKQKEKRLQSIRKKSLQKHNQRMNKLKEQNYRQSEYEMHLDTQEQYNQLPKIQFNSSKLEMYRQPIKKLPKICQQFDYSYNTGRNIQSINSFEENNLEPIMMGVKFKRQQNDRQKTNQFEDPLPTPCLTVWRGKR